MRDIKKCAQKYVRKTWANGQRNFGTLKQYCKLDYIAGAEEEREALLKWHDPKKETPPNNTRILIKINNEEFDTVITGKYCDKQWFLDTIIDNELFTIVGWREIYEL